MLVEMRDEEIKTIDDISCFLQAELRPTMALHGSKEVIYKWLERTLVRFRYLWLDKKQKGLVLRYIEHITGYSRQHGS